MIVSLVTSRATARVCSTTTDWLTEVSPPVNRRSGAAPRATPRPTTTASPNSSRDSSSGQTERRERLAATFRHGGLDLARLARRPAQPFDTGGGDRVVVFDPDADVVVAAHGGPHLGDHGPVLRGVRQDVEQARAHVDPGLDREHVSRGERAGVLPGMGRV